MSRTKWITTTKSDVDTTSILTKRERKLRLRYRASNEITTDQSIETMNVDTFASYTTNSNKSNVRVRMGRRRFECRNVRQTMVQGVTTVPFSDKRFINDDIKDNAETALECDDTSRSSMSPSTSSSIYFGAIKICKNWRSLHTIL